MLTVPAVLSADIGVVRSPASWLSYSLRISIFVS